MSTNAFSRLRALLPAPSVLIAKVIEINPDDTSTVELPLGLGNTTIANGVAVGTRLRVRGTTVPVGSNAFICDGVIETRAPDGDAVESVIGTIAALPFGPARLAFAGPVVPPPAASGVPYTLDLASYWTGGYSPRAYALTAGVLPSGYALDTTTGVIAGTRTGAASAAGLAVTCSDSTRRAVPTAPFAFTVS